MRKPQVNTWSGIEVRTPDPIESAIPTTPRNRTHCHARSPTPLPHIHPRLTIPDHRITHIPINHEWSGQRKAPTHNPTTADLDHLH